MKMKSKQTVNIVLVPMASKKKHGMLNLSAVSSVRLTLVFRRPVGQSPDVGGQNIFQSFLLNPVGTSMPNFNFLTTVFGKWEKYIE